MINTPHIGQRVRFTRTNHTIIPFGRGGMIDQVALDGQFIVLTDCGGWFGWTTFDSWESTGAPDEVLQPEYIAMRTQALCDDSRIKTK